MAMFPNVASYLSFPITKKRKKKNIAEPNLKALKQVMELINRKNEKTPTVEGKGPDHLK